MELIYSRRDELSIDVDKKMQENPPACLSDQFQWTTGGCRVD